MLCSEHDNYLSGLFGLGSLYCEGKDSGESAVAQRHDKSATAAVERDFGWSARQKEEKRRARKLRNGRLGQE